MKEIINRNKEKEDHQKGRKIRRSKKIRNKMNKFKIIYMNIRGIKSKLNSLEEIIINKEPDIICVVESLLQGNETVEITGYEVITVNRQHQGGGIVVAVKKELANITAVVDETMENEEMIWLVMDNGKAKVRIGIVYAPQESRTKVKEMRKIYKKIQMQIEEGLTKNQQIMVVGDFNCKVGNVVEGNKTEISSAGKMLLEMIGRTNCKIMNGSKKCKGLWTRKEGESKSVIDYVIMKEEDEEAVRHMIVDEEKEFTPYKSTETSHEERMYTDHNAIEVVVNWNIVGKKGKQRKRINIIERKKDEFKRATTVTNLTSIWTSDTTFQEKYSKWNKHVMEIMEQIFTEKQSNKPGVSKETRILRGVKKEIKKNVKETTNEEERKILRERRKLVEYHIQNSKKEEHQRKIKKLVQELRRENGFDRNTFWEYRRKTNGTKKETMTAIEDEQGELKEDKEEIREIYQRYYKSLLTTRPAENESETEVEKYVTTTIAKMEEISKTKEIEEITDEEYNKMKKELKNRKAKDMEGWKYELVKWAGEDLEKSIKIMLNQSIEEKEIPEEWKNMKIKSIYKNKGSKKKVKNRRGLFLTNILSKCMEKIISNRNKEIIERHISPFQCGGIRKRGITDNLFILNTIVNKYREEKQDLYILFADLEKCFDKLWLKDSIIELSNTGVPVQEVMYIYEMNRDVKAIVETPVGTTNEIRLEEIVRQGTIWGPTLCSVSTDRINSIGQQKSKIKVHNTEIKCPVFVDDILGVGNRCTIEEVAHNMCTLEKTKKFTFNNDTGKSEILVIENRRKKAKEEREEIKIQVRKGNITETQQYKYLGDYYTSEGNNNVKIEKRIEKIEYMASEVKRQGSNNKVGSLDLQIRTLLVDTIIKPSILYNTETWENLTKAEIKKINSAQYRELLIVFEQRSNTPYYGIIADTGIWPFNYTITYKKLMFLHNLVHSEESRIARKLLVSQMNETTNNWYNEIRKEVEKLDIDISIETVIKKKKSQWKKESKRKIEQQIRREINEKAQQSTKLRFLMAKEFKKEEYLEKCNAETGRKIMTMRLNMIKIKSNYKNNHIDTICSACKEEEETTEHILQCSVYKKLVSHELNTDNIKENMRNTKWLIEAAKVCERIEETKAQLEQYSLIDSNSKQ